MLSLAVNSGARRLAATLFASEDTLGTGPGLLFIHGMHSSQANYRDRAERAVEGLGAVCLTFDLGGHGQSEGDHAKLSPHDHQGDCIAAFDTLADDPRVDASRTGVCGASYGGFLATHLASERNVARLLLRAHSDPATQSGIVRRKRY